MKCVHNRKLVERLLVGSYLPTVSWIVLFCVLPAYALSGGPYELTSSTIDAGGTTSSGGPYVVSGTIGQPDAGWSDGGNYEVLGGFWPGGPLCFVEFGDFARFADYWLTRDSAGDLDSDQDLDFADVREFAEVWLYYCPSAWPLR